MKDVRALLKSNVSSAQLKYFSSAVRALGIIFFLYAGGINEIFLFLNFTKEHGLESHFSGSHNLILGIIGLFICWSIGFIVLRDAT